MHAPWQPRIRPTSSRSSTPPGFFRVKSKAIVTLSQRLVAEHGGDVPATMDVLTTLPGVGRKTANVVLGHALGVPGLPVDRHVLRVTERIGLTFETTPEGVERDLCAALPPIRLDAHVRRPDPARPAHLPARAALRRVLGRRRLSVPVQDRRACCHSISMRHPRAPLRAGLGEPAAQRKRLQPGRRRGHWRPTPSDGKQEAATGRATVKATKAQGPRPKADGAKRTKK